MKLDLDVREYAPPEVPGVKMKVRPLPVEAYQKVAGLVARMARDEKGRVGVLGDIGSGEMTKLMEQVFPGTVSDLSGVGIKEGGVERAAVVKDIHSYGALLPLGVLILLHLFSISTLTEDEVKN